MTKYRSRIEIVADVLDLMRHGALKTQIMYRGNLSFSLTERYLRDLIGLGLIEFNGAGKYQVTDTGLQFLRKFRSYKKKAAYVNQALQRVKEKETDLYKMCFREKSRESNGKAHESLI